MSNTSLVIDPRDKATLQDCRLADLLLPIVSPGSETPCIETLNGDCPASVSTPDVDAEGDRWAFENRLPQHEHDER